MVLDHERVEMFLRPLLWVFEKKPKRGMGGVEVCRH
jgi:hypothetical protein